MRFHYHLYGLTIDVNVTLPGLKTLDCCSGPCDLRVELGEIPEELHRLCVASAAHYRVEPGISESDPPRLIVNQVHKGAYFHLRYDNGIEFVLDRGANTVWGSWSHPTTIDDAALYLLGPIIGFALRLKGITCLHASGIIVEGGALAITGASGAGKSTLAAAFATAGYPVLTDDIVPLHLSGITVEAPSGYGRLRLYPSSYEHSRCLPDELPRLRPGWDKRYLALDQVGLRFFSGQAPLRMIYLLDWTHAEGSEVRIEPVSPTDAIPLLATHTYRSELLDAEMRGAEFLTLHRVVTIVPVRRIQPIDDIAAVPHLCQMILDDFHRHTGRGV